MHEKALKAKLRSGLLNWDLERIATPGPRVKTLAAYELADNGIESRGKTVLNFAFPHDNVR